MVSTYGSYFITAEAITNVRRSGFSREHRQIAAKAAPTTIKETLINSEFPQHRDVLPFSMTNKSLKMKKKGKSHFPFFVL